MASRIFGLIIISILLILIDIYIYRAIRSVSWKWKGQKHLLFAYIWWGYTFLLIAGVFVSIFFNIKFLLRSIILVVFFVTFVSKIFILPFLIADDLRRIAIWIKRKFNRKEENTVNQENSILRSEFLIKAGTLVAAIPLASLSYGVVSSAYDYRVKRRNLYLPNLPKTFDGIKLGQLSDIHSGSFYDRKAVIGGVDMLLKEKPDMIFFTGDLVNNVATEMYEYQDIFSKVKAPLGVFSVLGNHDYGDYHFGQGTSAAKIKNLADVKTTHKNMGWDLLVNENRRLKINGEEIAILGIENWGVGRFAKYGRMDLAIKDIDDVITIDFIVTQPLTYQLGANVIFTSNIAGDETYYPSIKDVVKNCAWTELYNNGISLSLNDSYNSTEYKYQINATDGVPGPNTITVKRSITGNHFNPNYRFMIIVAFIDNDQKITSQTLNIWGS
jgi:predicted MPP superfamily phosphohydrolase